MTARRRSSYKKKGLKARARFDADAMTVAELREKQREEKATWCVCCEQKIRKLNPHRMDKQKVRVLEDLAKYDAEGVEWVAVKHGHELLGEDVRRRTAYRASEHASRLKWFGLVDHRGHRTGDYRINARGWRFLRKGASVPAKILVRGGRVVERSLERARLRDVKGVVLDKEYWDNYGSVQESPWK